MAAYWNSARFDLGDLTPMLPAQPGVCDACFQPSDYRRCASCHFESQNAGLSDPPPLLPMALRSLRTPLAHATRAYKDADSPSERDASARQLAWLMRTFLSRHERCLAREVDADWFDYVVPVPSSGGRPGLHPLVALLRQIPEMAQRLVEALAFTGRGESHRASSDRFRVAGSALRGSAVLLVDDTLTRGAHAFSAVSALRSAGARVGVVVIGRHFDPDYNDSTRRYAEAATSLPYDFDYCAICDTRRDAMMAVSPEPSADSDPWADPWG